MLRRKDHVENLASVLEKSPHKIRLCRIYRPSSPALLRTLAVPFYTQGSTKHPISICLLDPCLPIWIALRKGFDVPFCKQKHFMLLLRDGPSRLDSLSIDALLHKKRSDRFLYFPRSETFNRSDRTRGERACPKLCMVSKSACKRREKMKQREKKREIACPVAKKGTA